MMEFGLSFLPDCSPDNKSGAQYFQESIDLSVEAEKLGYAYSKITEHYLHPYGGYCPDPLMFLSAVAARTSRLRLMTGGIIAPYSHPIQIASKIAMADAISNGRIEAGFVRGYLPFEYDSLGIPMDESKARHAATVKAVDLLLHNKKVSIQNDYFAFADATILPRPTQPRIPIWHASISRSSIEFAAANGYDVALVLAFKHPASIRGAIDQYRRENPAGRVCVFAPLVLDTDQNRAESIGNEHLKRYHSVWADAAASWIGRTSRDFDPMYGSLTNAIQTVPVEAMRELRTTYFGTPDDVRRRLDEMIEIIEPSRILWNVDIGSMPMDLSLQTIRLFADSIMSHYQ
ncbi:LLM class flavin-dependent oxidoreductase [Nitrospina gracilis]|uniref:LLM class flavin-dependent oxidoreductase n=1 Tax=Nitrospina gracilis TaxID=35801 RepID=UPI001F25E105|nr:LLM class flavin-dependent oxidoreductase [Nitrospina gracilis]MCF8721404.1 alkanesulfonate monooxygenase SsuD/methylene tetrahydromethanopterin reductase-like flavin-dependent oxidoreductase (luciferase family) [Nitrospina gracilis Nb-211]